MRKTLVSLIAAAAISGAAGASAQAEEIVVHKGDTLWGLSKEYGVSINSLKEWNNLSSDTIAVGDRLEVSPIKTVIVRQGDTLWGIGNAYGVSVAELQEWNHLSGDVIHPGQSLKVYADMAGEKKPNTSVASAPAEKKQSVKATAVAAKSSGQVKAASANVAPQGKELTVTATAYTANCEGCSGITKTGVNLKANPNAKVIAVDPSVIPLGSKVHVQGYGYATAADIGGAIKGNKIDVFIPNQQDALNWGRKQVKVTIIE